MIAKHRPLIYCELWDNEKREMTIALLEEIGYSTKIYDGKTLVKYNGQRNILNYFFVHTEAVSGV